MTSSDPRPRPKHLAGDGDVPSWWSSLDRRRLAVALGATFVAVPLVVADNLPSQHATRAQAEELRVEAGAETDAVNLALPSSTTVTVAAETTTTTEAPVESTTTTTAAPRPTTTTTAAPRATTTTASPPPTTTPPTTAAPAPATDTESGQATWYRYRDGECAHKTLPRGTVVTVTNVANGASATCVVTDRGPYGGSRIIDLDDGTFAQLAPLSAGVIDVVISW